ncbi:MAG: hypothetical protein LBJ97_04230 [Mycoplasmataceae bacterium]|nr:hypothetical protein [Mycoplasmataceae bacterium]
MRHKNIVKALTTPILLSPSFTIGSVNTIVCDNVIIPPPIKEQNISKENLNDLYGPNISIGSFSQKPNSEAVLSNVKTTEHDFHNEAPTWYGVVVNDAVDGVGTAVITPNDKCPYYTTDAWEVNWTLIDNRIDLNTVFSDLIIPITENIWNLTETQVINLVQTAFKSQFPTLFWNQIIVSHIDYTSNDILYQQLANITFAAVNGSNVYINQSTVNFNIPELTDVQYSNDNGITWSDKIHTITNEIDVSSYAMDRLQFTTYGMNGEKTVIGSLPNNARVYIRSTSSIVFNGSTIFYYVTSDIAPIALKFSNNKSSTNINWFNSGLLTDSQTIQVETLAKTYYKSSGSDGYYQNVISKDSNQTGSLRYYMGFADNGAMYSGYGTWGSGYSYAANTWYWMSQNTNNFVVKIGSSSGSVVVNKTYSGTPGNGYNIIIGQYLSGELQETKIWKNSTLVRDFIPTVTRETSSTNLYGCYYDLVNNEYYYSDGSNQFTEWVI